ncbi:hypothetical protein [Allonocardiopsis opalescens]|uniref:Uncharacterized protein n=1 Tax=Allonocardiopsis opalescens TaxID=1144618 RepID=A0A2T0Q1V6_9ACTN|nr:hypothetical protein [Allonocardiopsis opalescens]PRX97759.1 hypothetical protein CLV72_105109 [Allonocardiopsis opalescens]
MEPTPTANPHTDGAVGPVPARPALRPGAALFTVDGRGTALRSATGEMFDLALPEATARATLDALAGADGDVRVLREPLAAFASAGHLGNRPVWPSGRASVAVLTTSASLHDALAEALERAGARPSPVDDATTPRELAEGGWTAVCAIADGPAPPGWSALDALPAAGVAWQRVSREGRHVLLEPVASRPDDVSHTDVRRRRLAAAGSGHVHLTAYWERSSDAHTGAMARGDERLSAFEAVLVAQLAAFDLRLWATSATPRDTELSPGALPPTRRLRVLDLDSGAIADHPVLPVPPCAP